MRTSTPIYINMESNNLTLAITTIGDLLVENRISHQIDEKPIEHIHLTIPDYQRPYKWTAKNAIQLLDDILEARKANKESYRVGTLILHRDEKDGVEHLNIVDGQQRVITFSLLLRTLGEERIDFLEQKLADNAYNRHNVPNNLRAFSQRLKPKNINVGDDKRNREEIDLLRDYIKQRCEMVVVVTDSISEAFQFFDSQNARGRSLYPHDLLKAYHLREMHDVDEAQTERIVADWESNDQQKLAELFGDYLYRIKEWIHGNLAYSLNEQNIYKFKGLTERDRTPYAQFFKASFAYADIMNRSYMPFVSGTRQLTAFQLDAPLIAGKFFFDYTHHYFALLKDIQDNSRYEGFYINGNKIVETLDAYYSNGTGNRITRLLFDTVLLLYVDRFCPETFPTKAELRLFDDFTLYAFVWAYSLRAQYKYLGWASAQNYVLERSAGGQKINSLNLYKLVCEAYSPEMLLSELADRLQPLPAYYKKGLREPKEGEIPANYLYFFKLHNF